MATYQENLSRLNSEQRSAVEYLNGPLLVLAGPGTGKTQLLSMKVAYILENTDASPENILCITFTDSGCENMRERLASIIGAVPASKVHIHTYHNFGKDLLSLYKTYSATYDRRLESPIDEIGQYKIIQKIQESLPGTDILRGDSISNILEVIGQAKSHRLSASDLERIANINIAECDILSTAASDILKKATPRKLHPTLEDAYQPILDLFASYKDTAPIAHSTEHIIVEIRDSLKEAIETAVSANSPTALTNWRNDHFNKDKSGNYVLKYTIANKKLLSISHVMADYESHLRKEGLFDFNDMIEEAIHILETDEGFRLTLEERFQYILLDEFQDTNPSQFRIIDLLTSYESPCIMAVGDDDQAIYEFQGALASNLSDFMSHYNAKVINLVTNYRSTQDILDFSKGIISQATDSFASTVPSIEKSLTAFFKDKKGSIERHEFLKSDGEYYWISEKIHALLKSGVSPSDIAILTPKHKFIEPLLPFLHTHRDIKVNYIKNENILEDPRIHQLIVLCKFIKSLADGKNFSNLLPEILSFPFWDIPHLTAIEAIRTARLSKKSALEAFKNSEDKDLKSLADFLATLALRSFDTPFTSFINYLIGSTDLDGYRSHFLEYYSKDLNSYDTFTLFEKLSTLRSKLQNRELSAVTTPKLADFVSLIEDYELAEQGINSSSPYEEAETSVSIMTAHKSKGLEFEHVFLVACDNYAWGISKGNNTHLTLPPNLSHIRHSGTSDSECLRLLFVAVTRAKSHLYLTNSKVNYTDKSVPRLTYLDESEVNGTLISKYIPNDTEKQIICHYGTEENSHTAVDPAITWLDTYLHPDPDTFALYKKRIEPYRLSHSGLIDFIDIAYAGPKSFFAHHVLKVPRDPETYHLALGNSIHHTFEKITKEKITDEEAIDFFKKDIEKAEVDPADYKRLLEKGSADLAVSLSAFGEILRATNTRAEVDLSSERLSYEGVPLTGKIDHISINEEAKTIEIYDFKTKEGIKKGWGTKDASLFKYELQLCFYKLLLNLSPTYKNYTVSRAHILFVTPDKDGEVLDKIYDFSGATESLLKSLIKKVYGHIHSLDYLNDSSLMVNPDNTLGIDDIKSFIDLL